MFDIYFNKTKVDRTKDFLCKNTADYYKFEYENLNKSIQFAKVLYQN